jgi:predicted MFS family arabinose efflux permease
VLADRWLGVGSGGFGILLAAIGVGAVVGPMLLRRSIRPGDKRWLFGPFAVRSGVDLTLASLANPFVAGGALVAYGMSTSTGMVAYQSTLQTYVPAETRGRAFALYDVLWNGARLISLGIGGVLVDVIGVRAVYGLSACLLLAAAIVGLTSRIPSSTQAP